MNRLRLCRFVPYLVQVCLFVAFLSPVLLTGQQSNEVLKLVAPQDLEGIFPPSFYFRGKTAPVQWRNAAALRFSAQSIFFAGLIDSSGYASGIQDKYQMYLLTEQPMLIGDQLLPAGAYGAGFVGDRFVVMDIGGKTVAEGQTQLDEHFARPRPLQIVLPPASDARLYLGRRWIPMRLALPK